MIYVMVAVLFNYEKEKHSTDPRNYIGKTELGWTIFGLNTWFYIESKGKELPKTIFTFLPQNFVSISSPFLSIKTYLL